MKVEPKQPPSTFTRICARVVDYCLFFGFGLLFSLSLPIEVDRLSYLFYALLVPSLFVPVEAWLSSTWGKTLGQALLGISVHKKDGSMLSFKEALNRAMFKKQAPGLLTQKEPGLLRKLSVYAIAASLLVISILSKEITDSTIGGEQQQKISGWVQYTSKEAGFKVEFPNKPKVEEVAIEVTNSDKPVNYSEIKSEGSSKVTYAVSYIDIPKKWGFVSSKRILRGVMDVILKLQPGSELVSREFTSHKEFSAMDFNYKSGDEVVSGRLIKVGLRLFKLTISYPMNTEEKHISREFLNSFDTEKQAAETAAVSK
ncbi:MAG: RDD family protein [Chlamydiales bacterium]|nr:RDD family protein [Chlamydiales bacterium]